MVYIPVFFSLKCSLFHNSNLFGSCIVHILYTECAKIKKIIPAPKGERRGYVLRNAPLRDFVVVRTCAYTNLDSSLLHSLAIWYSLLLLGNKPVQHVTVLNTVGKCNTMVSTIILYYNTVLYYNIIILLDHRRICGPSLTEMSLCGA